MDNSFLIQKIENLYDSKDYFEMKNILYNSLERVNYKVALYIFNLIPKILKNDKKLKKIILNIIKLLYGIKQTKAFKTLSILTSFEINEYILILDENGNNILHILFSLELSYESSENLKIIYNNILNSNFIFDLLSHKNNEGKIPYDINFYQNGAGLPYSILVNKELTKYNYAKNLLEDIENKDENTLIAIYEKLTPGYFIQGTFEKINEKKMFRFLNLLLNLDIKEIRNHSSTFNKFYKCVTCRSINEVNEKNNLKSETQTKCIVCYVNNACILCNNCKIIQICLECVLKI